MSQEINGSPRRSHSDGFKMTVAIEAASGTMTLNELASKYKVHVNQIRDWKKLLLEQAPGIFSRKKPEHEEIKRLRHEKEELVHQIGELTVDNNYLKKNLRKLNLL